MELSAAQFRINCFKIFDEVNQTHKEVIITKRGKPIAKIVSYSKGVSSDPFIGTMIHAGETLADLAVPFEDEWEFD